MHEFGLTEAIAATVLERAGGRPVARVRVRMSALLRAEEDSMRQSFEMLGTGNGLQGAVLELETIPAVGRCGMCDRQVEIADRLDPCPECGEHAVGVSESEEMILEEIEYRPEHGGGG